MSSPSEMLQPDINKIHEYVQTFLSIDVVSNLVTVHFLTGFKRESSFRQSRLLCFFDWLLRMCAIQLSQVTQPPMK